MAFARGYRGLLLKKENDLDTYRSNKENFEQWSSIDWLNDRISLPAGVYS